MIIMQEETFGPIIPIQSFSDTQEAIDLANNCMYALGGSVIGRPDCSTKEYVAKRLRKTHGFFLINDTYITGDIYAE